MSPVAEAPLLAIYRAVRRWNLAQIDQRLGTPEDRQRWQHNADRLGAQIRRLLADAAPAA